MTITEQQLRDLYGRGAQIIRDRTAAIQQQFNDQAAQIDANATSRAASDAQTAQAQASSMQSAAMSLGLEAPPQQTGAGSAASFANVKRADYEGGAGDWRQFLATNRDITAGRNMATSHSLEAEGQDKINALNAFLASGGFGGGGGGGGRGGGGYDDEPEVTYPSKVAQMSPGVARGLAATRLRLEQMGGLRPTSTGKTVAMPKNYTYSVKANSDPKIRAAEAASNRR